MQNTEHMDRLKVIRCDSRREMGEQAALDAAEYLRYLGERQDEINIIFAAAPSQTEFLASLCSQPGIPWEKINAFQMDDYIGIREDAPQRFANFLNRAVFERVSLRSVMLLKCDNDADDEIARYSALLRAHPLDVAFIGIGENGHIAFNDPDIADFFDHEDIKRVKMAYESRQQQVNDGCFASLEDVPHEALTVTIPVILRAKRVFCIVPCHTKAQAVHDALVEKISTDCPASILRLHSNAALYLDGESASRL